MGRNVKTRRARRVFTIIPGGADLKTATERPDRAYRRRARALWLLFLAASGSAIAWGAACFPSFDDLAIRGDSGSAAEGSTNDAGGGDPYFSAVMIDHPIGYFRLNEAQGPVCQSEVDAAVSALYIGTELSLAVPGIDGTKP